MAGNKFGYTINSTNQIDHDLNDFTLFNFVAGLEPSLNTCISCGTCTATCTAGQFVDFNIRRVHTFLARGETGMLKKEIEKCMFCGKCQLACPRGVNLRNLIQSIHRSEES